MFGFNGKGGDTSGGRDRAQGEGSGQAGAASGQQGSAPGSVSHTGGAPTPNGIFGSQRGFGGSTIGGGFGTDGTRSYATAVGGAGGGGDGGGSSSSIFAAGSGFGSTGLTRQSSSGGGAFGGGFGAGRFGGHFSTFPKPSQAEAAAGGSNREQSGNSTKGKTFGSGGGFGGSVGTDNVTGGIGGFGGHPQSSKPPTQTAAAAGTVAAATKPSSSSSTFGSGGGFGTGGGGFGTGGGFGSARGFGTSGGLGGGGAGAMTAGSGASDAGGVSATFAAVLKKSAASPAVAPAASGFGTSGDFGGGGFRGRSGFGGVTETGSSNTRKKNGVSSTGERDASQAGVFGRGGFGGTGSAADPTGTSNPAGFATASSGTKNSSGGSSSTAGGGSFADAVKRGLPSSKTAWATASGLDSNSNSGFGGHKSNPPGGAASTGFVVGGDSKTSASSGFWGSGFGVTNAADFSAASAPASKPKSTAGDGAVAINAAASSGTRDAGGSTSTSDAPSGGFGRRQRTGAQDVSETRGPGVAGRTLFGVGAARGRGLSSTADGGAGGGDGRAGESVGQAGQRGSNRVKRRQRQAAAISSGDGDGDGGGGGSGTARELFSAVAGSRKEPTRRSRIMGMNDADVAAMSRSAAPAPTFLGDPRGETRRSGGGESKRSNPSAAGSRILGGFGAEPPSSTPPQFAGGLVSRSSGNGAGSTGGGSGVSAFGGSGANDAEERTRRAQRFGTSTGAGGGAGSGDGGGGGSRSRGGGKTSRGNGGGGGGDGGGGTAEDVQRGSHLDDAEIKVGTVEAMCPQEERWRRVPGDLHILEKEHPSMLMPDRGDGTPRQPWTHENLVVKRHQRAAAGMDISKAELLRTPPWLARTVDHLVMNCMDKGPHGGGDPAAAWADPRIQEYMAKFRANNPSRADLAEDETEQDLYNFVWDRFRMVRSDYNMQGYNPVVGLVSESSIVAHERMARWYVLMHNRMAKNTVQTHRFNLKSIVETLKKLYEFYSLRVAKGQVTGGLASPNEPEIMAYYFLTVLRQDDGGEVQRLVKDLIRNRREEVLSSPEIKGALRVVHAFRSGDYVAFFRAFREQGVMHRCLMAQYVGSMRATAIWTIGKCFHDMSVAELTRVLCFEDEDQAEDFLAAYGLEVNDDGEVRFWMKPPNLRKRVCKMKHPAEPVPTPPLQDLVEPKPWRKASEWVMKGDLEPAGNKSHDTAATGSARGSVHADSDADTGGATSPAASLMRATSSSSVSSMSGALRRATSATRSVTRSGATFSARSGSGTTAPSSKRTTPRTLFDSVPGTTLPGGGEGGDGGGSGGAAGWPVRTSQGIDTAPPRASVGGNDKKQPDKNNDKNAALDSAGIGFSSAVSGGKSGFSFKRPAGRAPVPPPPASGGDDNNAPSRGATGTPGTGVGAAGGTSSTSAIPGFSFTRPADSVDVPVVDQASKAGTVVSTSAGHGAAGGASSMTAGGTTMTTIPSTTFAAAAVGTAGAGTGPSIGAPTFARPPVSSTTTTPALPAHAPPAQSATASGPNLVAPGEAQNFSATAAATAAAAAAAAAARRQADEEAAREKAAREEAARETAARETAAREKAQAQAEAVVRAERALSRSVLVPMGVFDQLPLDHLVRKRAAESRKARGGVLMKLGNAVSARKRRACWIRWVEETRGWLEAEQMVEARNHRVEEHDALAGKSSWLRRRRPRSRSGGRSQGRNLGTPAAGIVTTTAAKKTTATTTRMAAAARALEKLHRREQSSPAAAAPLRKPAPLDLPAVLGAAVAKNQGTDAEAAFRAVGLARRENEGTGKDDPLSLPHLFWKAVIVVPVQSRGGVGTWLESKLRGGWGAGDEGGVGGYLGDVRRSQVSCPALDVVGHGGFTAEEARSGDVSSSSSTCGVWGSSRLINLSLKQVPRKASESTGQSKRHFPRWMHTCVQRVDVYDGHRIDCSPQLSARLAAASVIVFAASPKGHRRFFVSPFQPKPDWSETREDLQRVLRSASPAHHDSRSAPSPTALGTPVLIVIPVRDSVLLGPDGESQGEAGASDATTATSVTSLSRVRQRILKDATEGLGLGELDGMGFSFRVMVVGLHDFESKSRAAAAAGEGLVFSGRLEEACSREFAHKLADLSEQSPLQPLVATRSLPEMLSTAVSRATTDNHYAKAAGLDLPASPYEDPPLDAVVAAATRATAHVADLLSRKPDNNHRWPIPEFTIAGSASSVAAASASKNHMQLLASSDGGGCRNNNSGNNSSSSDRRLVQYVLGAARPAGGELTPSTLYYPAAAQRGAAEEEAEGELNGKGGITQQLRGLIGSYAGLPADWECFSTPAMSPAVMRVIRAATPSWPVPPEILQTFGDSVLAGKKAAPAAAGQEAGRGARALGEREAWARVERLDAYLGSGVLSDDLRCRLAEALARGVMMRGAPPPWRALVRHAVVRKLSAEVSDGGPIGTRPMVVHFVAASGQQRLADGGGLVPGLLEAERLRPASSGDSKRSLATDTSYPNAVRDPQPSLSQQDVLQWAATLKREAPTMASTAQKSRDSKQRRLNTSPSTSTTISATPAAAAAAAAATTTAISRTHTAVHSRSGTPKRKHNTGEIAFFESPSSSRKPSPAVASGDRRHKGEIEQLRRETEELRVLADQQSTRVEANIELDKAFLRSFGITLPAAGSGVSGSVAATAADRTPDHSRPHFNPASFSSSSPLFGRETAATAVQGRETTRAVKAYEARRRKAEATLTATEYRCWMIREERIRDRRAQDQMWARVFNGDPLAVPPSPSSPGPAGFC